jgi:prepilin-type N-terminal cleavage/methylation domain-containing protein
VSTDRPTRRSGFTLLEVMVALAILAISVMVLIDAQTAAVEMREQGDEMVVGTLLARDIMTLVELRMEKEGFGELTITEDGDFRAEEYLDGFEEHRWEYEVSRIEIDIGRILDMVNQLMGMAEDEGAVEDADMLTGGFSMESLGLDPTMFTDELSRFVREIRVRVYWCGEEGRREEGYCGPDEVVLITHIINPTGRVASAEDQEIGGLGGIGGIGGGAMTPGTEAGGSTPTAGTSGMIPGGSVSGGSK